MMCDVSESHILELVWDLNIILSVWNYIWLMAYGSFCDTFWEADQVISI